MYSLLTPFPSEERLESFQVLETIIMNKASFYKSSYEGFKANIMFTVCSKSYVDTMDCNHCPMHCRGLNEKCPP